MLHFQFLRLVVVLLTMCLTSDLGGKLELKRRAITTGHQSRESLVRNTRQEWSGAEIMKGGLLETCKRASKLLVSNLILLPPFCDRIISSFSFVNSIF